MIGTIFIEGLRVECIVGVYQEERQSPQPLIIDLALDADIAAPAASDDVQDALDYAAVAALAKEIAITSRHRLLESLAKTTLEQILAHFPCERAAITIRKPQAIRDANAAGVRLELRRGDSQPDV
ncbi:MAG: dihydroneopterin aldolase [Planctomycetota bacterium]